MILTAGDVLAGLLSEVYDSLQLRWKLKPRHQFHALLWSEHEIPSRSFASQLICGI